MKFMVCYDDTNVALRALQLAQKHAKVFGASLEIVQVIEREIPIKRSRVEEMEAAYESTVKELFAGVDVLYKTQLQIDDIDKGEEIIRLAKRKKVECIFIGIKRRSRVGKAIFGSTARTVIMKAPCPVFTVNRQAVGFSE